MKFRISKVSSSSNPKPTNQRIKNISPTLYDDPAFSPDPHSHPFFATSHDAAWAPPPAATHSNIDLNTRPPFSLSPPVADNFVNVDELHQQPPNPSMSPDEASANTLHNTQPFPTTTNAFEYRPPLASTSSEPRSVDSQQPLEAVPKSLETSSSIPQKKKKNSITMFWRKPEPLDITSKPAQLEDKRHEPPPSYDTIFSTRPTHSRNLTAPEIQHSVNRPSMPPRPATTAVDVKPPPTAIGGRPIRALDRIDELDESNPLGLPVHHGGPYEAIQKLVQQNRVPHNVGSQYQVHTLYLYLIHFNTSRRRPMRIIRRNPHLLTDTRTISQDQVRFLLVSR
jgi:hypothetical protein